MVNFWLQFTTPTKRKLFLFGESTRRKTCKSHHCAVHWCFYIDWSKNYLPLPWLHIFCQIKGVSKLYLWTNLDFCRVFDCVFQSRGSNSILDVWKKKENRTLIVTFDVYRLQIFFDHVFHSSSQRNIILTVNFNF